MHSPEFAAKAGVAQSVGRDFVDADKRAHRYQRRSGGSITERTTGMATVDLRGQRDKARGLVQDNDVDTRALVRIGDKAGMVDDLGDRGDKAGQGLQHYDTGLIDPHGHLQDGHMPRGRPAQVSRDRKGQTKVEDPGLDLARPGTLRSGRYADAGMPYDIRRDGAGSGGE